MKQYFIQIMLLFLMLITVALTGCNDGTLFLSQEQEIQLGKDAADAFEKENRIVPDRDLNRLIDEITRQLQKRNITGKYTPDKIAVRT